MQDVGRCVESLHRRTKVGRLVWPTWESSTAALGMTEMDETESDKVAKLSTFLGLQLQTESQRQLIRFLIHPETHTGADLNPYATLVKSISTRAAMYGWKHLYIDCGASHISHDGHRWPRRKIDAYKKASPKISGFLTSCFKDLKNFASICESDTTPSTKAREQDIATFLPVRLLDHRWAFDNFGA